VYIEAPQTGLRVQSCCDQSGSTPGIM